MTRCCLHCDYWLPPAPTEPLTTETRGQCLTIGSPERLDFPRASDVCDLWEPEVSVRGANV